MGGRGLQAVSSLFKFSSGHISTLADEVPPDLKHQHTLLPRAKLGDVEERIQMASVLQRHTQPPPCPWRPDPGAQPQSGPVILLLTRHPVTSSPTPRPHTSITPSHRLIMSGG